MSAHQWQQVLFSFTCRYKCTFIFIYSLCCVSFLIVLADANFPASSICACGPKEIRADGKEIFPNSCSLNWSTWILQLFVIITGLGIPTLLEAILMLLPLDTYVTCPVILLSQALSAVLIRNILVGNCLIFVNLHSQAAVMELVERDKIRGLEVPVWDKYKQLLSQAGSQVTQRI